MPARAPHMGTKLIESAFELFSRRGFHGVNLGEIAAHTGVTKGSLYWHYKSRKALILAACTHFYRQWQEQLQATIADTTDPLERLRRALLFAIDNCLLNPANRMFESEIYAMALHDEEIRTGWVQFYDAVSELFVDQVESARAAGKISTSDPRRAVRLMVATIDGIEKRAAFDPSACEPDQRQAIFEDVMRIICQT